MKPPPLKDPFHPPSLCETCPLRSVGLTNRGEIVPGNGAVTAPKLKKGSILTIDDLAAKYSLLRHGTLRVEYVSDDGRPEIAGFLFPGEPVIAPFSPLPMQLKALEDSVVCSLDPSLVLGGSKRAGELIHSFARAVATQAIEDQHRLLCARTGEVVDRVRWFLGDIAERQGGRSVRLKMSREDIAHYLHVSTESISRALTALEQGQSIRRAETRLIELL